MRKIFCIICLFGCSLIAYPQHSPELNSPIQSLYRLEETRSLLNKVESEGPIKIKAVNLGRGTSTAMWFPDERTICINLDRRSQGSLTRSIVFELYNAQSQSQFDHLDQLAARGEISREHYIESIERLEYSNVLKTAQTLQAGVQQRIFSQDGNCPIAPNFEEHYRVQKQAGHSGQIGIQYDNLRNNPNIMFTKKG